MIEKQVLESWATEAQTTLRNIIREYAQHLFLASFYKRTGSEDFLFKGGTALKLIFGSPRFSEDIDFSGIRNSVNYEKILEHVLVNLSFENIKVDLSESKPTTGGHLAFLTVTLFGEKIELRNEISFRPKKSLVKEATIVSPKIAPAYRVYALDRKTMVAEKVQALIGRQKPRDFFDLYFILRKEELRQCLKLETGQRRTIVSLLGKQDKAEIARELNMLLPKSFWSIIKDVPGALKRELEKGN